MDFLYMQSLVLSKKIPFDDKKSKYILITIFFSTDFENKLQYFSKYVKRSKTADVFYHPVAVVYFLRE